MIGYANRNGTVHYIETEWFPQLHGMLLTSYNTIESVMQLVNQNNVEIVEHAHKFFTKDFDIPYYYLFSTNNIWYLLSRNFKLYFPKKLSDIMDKEVNEMMDSMKI